MVTSATHRGGAKADDKADDKADIKAGARMHYDCNASSLPWNGAVMPRS